MLFLCVFLFFENACAYEVTTKPGSAEHSDIFDLSRNVTTASINSTVYSERITQPSQQTQQIDRALEPNPLQANVSKKEDIGGKSHGTLGNFKPSPQLETYYEYNKFPVVPAFPEAKTFGSSNDGDSLTNNWSERPIAPPWIDKPTAQGTWSETPRGHQSWGTSPNSEQPWTTRVKFPEPSYNSPSERPYKFITNNENYPPTNFPVATEGFSFNKPVEKPIKQSKPTVGFWQKLMGFDTSKNKAPDPVQKTFFDYNLLEKPPQYNDPKDHAQGMSHGEDPWKKIIKLLTTILPLGLLISALTPTVITVTSMNDTQSRYRADDSKHQELANRLSSSLKYSGHLNHCEDKILCELLVSASSSKNSEQHIENLLTTFVENKDLESKKEDLLKVFEAVRNQDCSKILCPNIRNPT